MKYLIILYTLYNFNTGFSQNLVQNGNFEESRLPYNKYPSNTNKIDTCTTFWKPLFGVYGFTYYNKKNADLDTLYEIWRQK